MLTGIVVERWVKTKRRGWSGKEVNKRSEDNKKEEIKQKKENTRDGGQQVINQGRRGDNDKTGPDDIDEKGNNMR